MAWSWSNDAARNARAMRVLAVSAYGEVHVGGAERYLVETVARLDQNGIDVRCLCGDAGVGNKTTRPLLPLFSGGFDPRWSRRIDWALADWRPDVVYAHWTVPGLVDVAVRRAKAHRVPVCLVYHSDVTGHDWPRRLLGAAYYRLVGLDTLRDSAVIVVPSEVYRRASRWLAVIARDCCRYVEPGVDQAFVRARRLPVEPYLLFVGKADSPAKGFAVLYQAWQQWTQRHPGVGLTVVGRPPRGRYPGTRLIPPGIARAALADLYASALVTVLPSLTSAESFGMVLAESLVAGSPVIGSEIGGIPAVVAPGRNGYLVPPGNVEALRLALEQVWCRQEQLRGWIASVGYAERFSWDKATASIRAALLDSIDPGNRRGC